MLVRYKVSGRDEVVERVVERAAAVGAPLAELKAHLAATLGPGFWLSANTLQHCSQIADAARIDCVHPHGGGKLRQVFLTLPPGPGGGGAAARLWALTDMFGFASLPDSPAAPFTMGIATCAQAWAGDESAVTVALPQGRYARVPVTPQMTCARLREAVAEAAQLPHECLDVSIMSYGGHDADEKRRMADPPTQERVEHSRVLLPYAGVTPATTLAAVERLLPTLPGAALPGVRLSALVAGAGAIAAGADRLYIKLPWGAFAAVALPPGAGSVLELRVDALQQWAAGRLGAPQASATRLYRGGKPLGDASATLRQCGLRSGALVHCVQGWSAPERGLHCLSVVVSAGEGGGQREVELADADPWAAVGSLKALFAEKTGFPAAGLEGLAVWLCGVDLDDRGTLAGSGVQDGSRLYLARPAILPVHVTTQAGASFTLVMAPADSVAALRARVEEVEGTPAAQQRLVAGGSGAALDDGRRALGECGLRGEARVYLLSAPRRRGTQIFVRNLGGRTRALEVDGGATVEYAKGEVLAREGIPVREQRLLYGGKQLEDGRTLASYGVVKESTLYLALRLRGGALRYISGCSGLVDLEEVDRIVQSGRLPLEVVLPDCSSLLLSCARGATAGDAKAQALRALRRRAAAELRALDLERADLGTLQWALRVAREAVGRAQK